MRIAAPLLAVASTGAGENPAVLGDALPSLGGGAPPDEGSLFAPGKGSAGDAAPDEGAAGGKKSILVRLRIWSTDSCTRADRPTRHWRFRG